VISQKDSNPSSGEHSTASIEKITQQHNEFADEIEQINEGNEWLEFLNSGEKKTPYLKKAGRLKKRPKVMHISAKQRRIYQDG
jgi:hypothetical protein